MAYANRDTNARRAATGIAVALIQGAAVYALVTGLAVHFTATPPPPPLAGDQIPLPPPPPKPDELKPQEEKTARLPSDERTPPLPQQQPVTQSGSETMPGGPSGPGAIADPPEPPQQPAFTPRAARPRNNPGEWASELDYPARDLREGNQGTARFRLSIGADGRVQSCEITASSGFPGLDAATCRKVSQRARFDPATNGDGNGVAGTYSGSIRWVIPD